MIHRLRGCHQALPTKGVVAYFNSCRRHITMQPARGWALPSRLGNNETHNKHDVVIIVFKWRNINRTYGDEQWYWWLNARVIGYCTWPVVSNRFRSTSSVVSPIVAVAKTTQPQQHNNILSRYTQLIFHVAMFALAYVNYQVSAVEWFQINPMLLG